MCGGNGRKRQGERITARVLTEWKNDGLARLLLQMCLSWYCYGGLRCMEENKFEGSRGGEPVEFKIDTG